MLNELLIEIFSEEIPAKLQKKALQDAGILMKKLLNEYGMVFDIVKAYISPRRIAIRIDNLQQQTRDLHEEKRGPKIGANQNAIAGFLRSNNKQENELIERDGYYFLQITTCGIDVKSLFADLISNFIEQFPWPKTMHWYLPAKKELSAFWIRPIRSILCTYNDEIINVYIKSVDINTSNITYGHRFLSNHPIKVKDFEDYQTKLEKNYVMLDYEKKVKFIDTEMAKITSKIGVAIQLDDDLLHENAGLVEWPFFHIGSIDERFMHLPKEVLSTSMKVCQKYFTLVYQDSSIAPFFGAVLNVPINQTIADGLNRVLTARLSDAEFFFKEDTDISLDAFAQRLSNLVFHEKLGTVAQKVDRMLSLAETKEENRAISLCKADLLTQMVGEFPELQGIVGAIYAKHQDEDKKVYDAIRDHYMPCNANDKLPLTETAARVSFFDKLDTLVGFIGIGILPTGSKDPFALRRSAFSIIKLICSNFNVLGNETLRYYIQTLVNSYIEQGIVIKHDATEEIIGFIIERFKVFACEKLLISYECVDAAVKTYQNKEIDLQEIIKNAKILEKLSKFPEYETIKQACKRVNGLLQSAPDYDVLDIHFINTPQMNDVRDFLLNMSNNATIEEYFKQIAILSNLVLDACEKTMIMDKDVNLRNANLSILSAFINIIETRLGII